MQLTKLQRLRSAQLAVELERIIRTAGGSRTGSPASYNWSLPTAAGPLRLVVRPNVATEGATVFARFDDADRAREVLGITEALNKYSGKWNHHYFIEDIDADAAVHEFGRQLRRVIR